ncbi:MAG: SRPBCC family protein [Acetobacteraceae bacterium]|nr:SRPBCC family protein [Acetobacteraceae bacterium]
MSDIDGNLSPPGTQLAPRHNLHPAERGISVAAGTLLGAIAARQNGGIRVALGLLGSVLMARGVTGVSPAKRLLGQRPDEAAVAKAAKWSNAALLSRSVTINAPRSAVFARFRDLARWQEWAQNVKRIDVGAGGTLHFVTMDPSGAVEWDGEITEEREDFLLAIASVPGSRFPISTRYEFRDAPAGRGTEIHGVVAYEPPGGSLVRYAAKLTQREPGIQLRRDLKRFKSLVETGEIAVNDPQGTTPKA